MNLVSKPGPRLTQMERKFYRPEQYRYFGILRLLLAVMVMISHFGNNIPGAAPRDFIFPLGFGAIGVVSFFALSGFIIMEAANEFYKGRPLAFAINRFLRIFPPFAAALAISVATTHVLLSHGALHPYDQNLRFAAGDFAPMPLLRNLLSPIPGLKAPGSVTLFLAVEWAIRVELQFYLVVALAMAAALAAQRRLRLNGDSALERVLGAAAAVHCLGFLVWASGHAPATFSFVPYFVFGAAAFYAVRGSRPAVAWAASMLPLIVYQYAAYEVPALSAFQVDTTIPPLVDRPHETLQIALVVGILGLMVALSQATLPISRRLDQFCGDLSYPLYLNHVLAGHVAASLYPGPPDLRFLLACATALALALLMHLAVEPHIRPLRTAVRGRPIP